MAPGISEDDDPTVESLTRDKSELFSEHGLENTALGDAAEALEDEKHEELTKHRDILEAKIAVQKARDVGIEDDPTISALAEMVEDLSEETEAAALVEHHEEVEARDRIAELESLANSTDGKTSASFEQKAAALREKHGLTEEPGRYDVEALEQDEEVGEAAEALAEFQDRKEATIAEEDLDDEEAKARLADFKQMREQASTPALRQLYQNKIDDLLSSHAE